MLAYKLVNKQKIIVCICLVVGAIACRKKDDYSHMTCPSTPVTYELNIKPLISTYCSDINCHGTNSPNGDYGNYASLMLRVNNGRFAHRVLYARDMPKNQSLSLDERRMIKCWLDAGALKE